MNRFAPLIGITIGVVLTIAACGDPEEFADFQADDVDDLPACMADEFPFEPAFLAARTRDNRTGIFLQTSPDVKSRSDVVYFELYDSDSIDTETTLELGEASVPPPDARGKMAFFASCPQDHETLKLEGTLRFEAFETGANGIIDGHLEDGRAVNARTGETRIDDLSGSWRFLVRRGPPHEEFFALPQRP